MGFRNPRKKERQILNDNNHSNSPSHSQHTNTSTSESKQHSCVQGPLRECCSIRTGASRLPCSCTPLLCDCDVVGGLTVWRHNTQKKNRTMLGDIGPRHIESELCGCNKTFRVIAWNLCTFRVIAWNLCGLPENGPSRCAWNTLVRQGGVLCYSIQTGTRISNHCWKLCHGFLIVFCAMRKITFIRSASGREQTTGRWHWLGSHLCTCVDTHFGPKPGAVDRG
jgi:hypothetical protein